MACQAPQSSQPIKENRCSEYHCKQSKERNTFTITVSRKSKRFCNITALKITVTTELVTQNPDALGALF